MGEGPSGGDEEAAQVNKSAGTKNNPVDPGLQKALNQKNNATYDSITGDTYSYEKPAGNWKGAGTKTVTTSVAKTAFTDAIMNSQNPQAALYDYSNKVRAGTAGKVSNKEMNALEAAGLDTFGMGLRGTEMFGGKMGHDDYGTPMSRQDYRPEILNQGGDPTDEAQRVNNPKMAALVGGLTKLTPVGTIASGMQMAGLAPTPGTEPTTLGGKIAGALTLGLTNPANPDLYDAGNYNQAMQRSLGASQFVNDPNNFSVNQDDDDDNKNQPTSVGANLSSGLNSGGQSQDGGATPDYQTSTTVTGNEMPDLTTGYANTGNGGVNAIVNYLSNTGRNRTTGDATVDADKQNFGAFRRMNFGNVWNVGDGQDFDTMDWRKNRRFGNFFNIFK